MAQQRMDIDINAKMDEANRAINQYNASLEKSNKLADDLKRKMSQVGGTASYKSVSKASEASAQSNAGMSQSYSKIENLLNDLIKAKTSNTSNLSDSDDKALAQSINRLTSLMESAKSQGFSGVGSTGSSPAGGVNTDLSSLIRQIMSTNAVTGVPTGVSKGSTSEERLSNKANKDYVKDVVSSIRSEFNSIRNNAHANDRRIDRGHATGKISYKQNETINTANTLNSSDIETLSKSIDQRIGSFDSRIGTNKTSIAGYQDKYNESTSADERDEIQKQITLLSNQNEAYEDANNQLKQFKDNLGDIQKQVSASKQSISDQTGSGQISVGASSDSLIGRLNSRKNAIASATASTAIDSLQNYNDRGNTIRTNVFDAMGGNLFNSSAGFDKSLDNINAAGRKNGDLSASESLEMSSAFVNATGNVNQASKATAYGGQLGVYGGIGVQNASQLASAGGNIGINSAKDFKDLGDTLVGSIQNAGLGGKANTQTQGFNSILGTLQGQNFNEKQAGQLASLYNGMGKVGGSAWQGQAGAEGMTKLAQGITQGYNDPVSRFAFGGNQAKYQGVHGQAQLYADMNNPLGNAKNLSRYISGLKQFSGGDSLVAAQQLSQRTGITMEQAQKAVKASDNGDMDKFVKDYKKDEKKGEDKEKKGKDDYNDSGVATVRASTAIIDANSLKTSEKFDSARKTKNSLGSHPLLSSLGSGLMQGAGSMGGIALSSIAGSLFKKGGSKLLTKMVSKGGKTATIGKGASKVVEALGGKGATNLAEDAIEKTSKASKGGKLLGKGGKLLATGGALLGGSKLVKGARGAGGAIKNVGKKGVNKAIKGGSKAIKKVATSKVGSKVMSKVSKKAGGKLLGKVGGKLGLKAAGAIPGLGTLVNAGFAIDDLKSGNYVGAAGDALGMIPGLGIAGTAISVGSEFLPKKKNKENVAKAATIPGLKKKGEAGRKASDRKSKETNWISENKKIIEGYNKMLDKMQRTAAIMKASMNGSGSGDSNSDSTGDGSDISGLKADKDARKTMMKIADAVGKKTGIDPAIVMGQLWQETGGKLSDVAKKDNNYSGITWSSGMSGQGMSKGSARPGNEGGNYVHFDTIDDFANYYAGLLGGPLHGPGLKKAHTAMEAAQALGPNGSGYYRGYGSASDVPNYAAGMQTGMDYYKANHAIGGIFGKAHTARIAEGNMPEAVIPLGQGERSQGRSLLRQASGVLGMDLGSNAEGSSSSTMSNNTTVSPSYNITIQANGGNEVASQMRQIAEQSARDMSEIIQSKVNFYQNNIVRG